MPIYAIGAKRPQVAESVWIAPNAIVIGDVRLAGNVSIWWNAVLRGDNDPISIGENTLFKSCTIPLAKIPMLSTRCARRIRDSNLLRSVTSVHT